MRLSKPMFIKYVDMFGVCAALLNVVKFVLQRDIAALRAISIIAAVSFAAFAGYLTLVARVKVID